MSDFNAIHDGLNAALNGCDLDLPAGLFMNSKNLSPFVPAPLTIADLNDKVRRILREVVFFGFLDRQRLDPAIPLDDPSRGFLPWPNGGQALAEILFGDVNPSGKLPVTFERRIDDNPAFKIIQTLSRIAKDFSLAIGPLFPFGFGLSYTTFSYSHLKIEPTMFSGARPINVSFTVTNTGTVAGAEIAELYVGQQNPPISRPLKELKGFDKVFLEPGQSKTVTLELNQRSFAYFNTASEKWDAWQR